MTLFVLVIVEPPEAGGMPLGLSPGVFLGERRDSIFALWKGVSEAENVSKGSKEIQDVEEEPH